MPDINAIEVIVARSRGLSLDVYLDGRVLYRVLCLHPLETGYTHPMLSFFAQILPRIRVLIMHVYGLDDFMKLFPIREHTRAPKMSVFGLFVDHGSMIPYAEHFGTINAPNISSLIFFGSTGAEDAITSFTPTSLLALRRLTIYPCRPPSYSVLTSISLCRNIQHLHWEGLSGGGLGTGPSIPEMIFPSLQTLHFGVKVSTVMEDVLKRFHAPALESIHFDSHHPFGPSMHIILLTSSLLHLRKLNLCHVQLVEFGIMWFNRFPCLTSLGIFDSWIQGHFFSDFASHHDAVPLPSLEELIVSRSYFVAVDLAQFVKRRSQSHADVHSPLTTVEIRGYVSSSGEENFQDLIHLQETYSHIVKYIVDDEIEIED